METVWELALYVCIFLYGIVIGSFLNVCIYRIPAGESLSKKRSHCMSCGYQLRWFDLVQLFSWLFLRGKCRKCGQKISPQYPIIEASNGVLYLLVFFANGFGYVSILYCLLASALLALSVIDFRTFIIPPGFNVFILCLGIVNIVLQMVLYGQVDWVLYVVGFFSVGLFTLLLHVLSKGKAIGGGDVKLMAATGLLIGWKLIVLSFVLGCILGSVIHLIRMKVSKEGRVLAMGPYLSMGIMLSVLWGEQFLSWYFKFLGI